MGFTATLRRSVALGRLGLDVARVRRRAPGAGRVAAERLVARRLGRLHGLPQKVGQILSLAQLDGGSTSYDDLTEAAEQAPARDSFRWIAHGLGGPLRELFLTIAPSAAAASLGQVHRAVLPDGRAVAVKVQYPDVAGAIDADLAAIGLIAAPISPRRDGFDADGYRTELRRMLTAELDYRAEAEALRRFAARRPDVPGLVTPDPIDGYCTDRVLTMTWVDGEAVAEARSWSAADRGEALRVLVRSFLRGCFVWREVHADPHPGNLRFLRADDGVRVGLLDFGCTHHLTAHEAWGLHRLVAGGAQLDEAELADAWTALGFPPQVTHGLRHRLAAVTRVLAEPFNSAGPFDAGRWQVADRLAAALGDDRWTFRFAGPPSLLFLIRAFQGLVVYARALDAAVDWRAELLALPAPAAVAPLPTPTACESTIMASHALKVEVVRDGQRVVAVSFPAGAVAHLADLVPTDLLARVTAQGISLDALARETVSRGCPPGDLIRLDDAVTCVRVWLE